MEYVKPTIEEFKTYFARNFPFQPAPPVPVDPNLYVQDSDIEKAFLQTDANFILGCFHSQESFTIAYMNLAAHYLVMAFRTASAGMVGTFSWAATSKSVGSVSVSNTVPQKILDNPLFGYLAATNYGTEYLISIIPCLVGRVFTVPGRTHA